MFVSPWKKKLYKTYLNFCFFRISVSILFLDPFERDISFRCGQHYNKLFTKKKNKQNNEANEMLHIFYHFHRSRQTKWIRQANKFSLCQNITIYTINKCWLILQLRKKHNKYPVKKKIENEKLYFGVERTNCHH